MFDMFIRQIKKIRGLWLLSAWFFSSVINAQNSLQTGVSFYKVNPETETIRMYWRQDDGTPYQTLGRLIDAKGKSHQINMAINGGIYDKEYRPEGLYIENGKTLRELNTKSGEGNFYIRPGGVFSIGNGQAKIETLEAFSATPDITFAVQSGPMLLQHGKINTKFSQTSESRKIRNAVGLTAKGDIYFLLSRQAMNFYEFAHYAAEQLNITELLYLDGTISGMYTPSGGVPSQRYPFVTMITVERK